MDPVKVCNRCKEELPLDEFPRAANSLDGHANYCKTCKRDYTADRMTKKRKLEDQVVEERQSLLDQHEKMVEMNVILTRELDLKTKYIQSLEAKIRELEKRNALHASIGSMRSLGSFDSLEEDPMYLQPESFVAAVLNDDNPFGSLY